MGGAVPCICRRASVHISGLAVDYAPVDHGNDNLHGARGIVGGRV